MTSLRGDGVVAACVALDEADLQMYDMDMRSDAAGESYHLGTSVGSLETSSAAKGRLPDVARGLTPWRRGCGGGPV